MEIFNKRINQVITLNKKKLENPTSYISYNRLNFIFQSLITIFDKNINFIEINQRLIKLKILVFS